jgi:RHS repeat-associated protein
MHDVLRLEKVGFLLATFVFATLASASGVASSRASSAAEDLAGCPTDFVTDDPARWITTNGLDRNAPSLAASHTSSVVAYRARDRRLAYSTASVASTVSQKSSPTAGDPQTTTYVYDALGNLLSVSLPGGTSISYQVDGRNRRVGKRVGGIPTQGFLYESDLRLVAELDGGNAVVSRFVYGTKVNVPEYMVKGGATYRIITDHLGSPRLVVNVATGAIAQRMDYDEFGRVLNDTNPGFQPFGFAGGLYDQDTKLVRFGARDYDAASGRWTSKDPVGVAGPDTNLFAFVASDPVNYVDHDGKEPTPASGATTSGTTAVASVNVASSMSGGGASGGGASASCGGTANAKANDNRVRSPLQAPSHLGPQIGRRIVWQPRPDRSLFRSMPTTPTPSDLDDLSLER